MEKVSPGILKTKQHFEALDGLRGIAALAVVTFHFMEVAYTDYSRDFIGHGFLAVDFFFCLSGFVIAYAYDDRIDKIGVVQFFKSRLIRLHPLVFFGSVLGLMTFLFDPFGAHPEAYNTAKLIMIVLTSILLIPYPVMSDRYFNLFGLNAPAWSLFWEYIANIVYALILYRLPRRYLVALAIIAAIILCMVGRQAGNLLGGWSGDTFWHGGARVFYSFLAGLTIYRFNLITKNKLGFTGIAALLFLAFIMPFSNWNWLTEPLVILLYFPFIISLGAGVVLSDTLKKVCNFLGNISYPLYMTHYAVLWMFANYYLANKPDALHLSFIIIAALIILPAFAFLVMKAYDIPLRRYLTGKRKQQVN